jgi:hypothetical protein
MTKHSGPPSASAATPPAAEWWSNASFGTFFDACGNWLRNAARVQEESMHFAHTRLQRNIEAATGFAACRTPGDLVAMQSRYASEMMSDYLGEGRKVVELLKH